MMPIFDNAHTIDIFMWLLAAYSVYLHNVCISPPWHRLCISSTFCFFSIQPISISFVMSHSYKVAGRVCTQHRCSKCVKPLRSINQKKSASCFRLKSEFESNWLLTLREQNGITQSTPKMLEESTRQLVTCSIPVLTAILK